MKDLSSEPVSIDTCIDYKLGLPNLENSPVLVTNDGGEIGLFYSICRITLKKKPLIGIGAAGIVEY